jgi:Zn-dependent protease with chaperone function
MNSPQFSHLTRTLALREQSRRRVTLVAMSMLLVLSTSPVYVHHIFALGAPQILAGLDHWGALCITALHLLLLPVHRFFHIIILAGVSYAAWDRFSAWRAVRTTLRLLEQRAITPGERFWRAASAVGLEPRCVRVVVGLPNPAFTVGLLAPRVYLAEELADRLTLGELEAVLAHEGEHVARRDPLRLFLLRLLGCTLFWIPALRRLADDVRDEAEVRADDVAVRGAPLILASAILAISSWRATPPTPRSAVGFHRDDLLERRVRRLAGEEAPVRSHLTRRSIFGAAVALSLVWTSGVVMAHPLSSHASHVVGGLHCQHHGESALKHLFCLGSPLSRTLLTACPHRVAG